MYTVQTGVALSLKSNRKLSDVQAFIMCVCVVVDTDCIMQCSEAHAVRSDSPIGL